MTNEIYDVHSHFILPEYYEMVRNNYFMEDSFPVIESWTPEEHLNYMEQAGITWSLLALSSPHPFYHHSEKKCIALMRHMNERLAEIKRQYPDKFGFAAALPHPDNDAAVEEAVHALDNLNANAIKLASNSRGLYIGDAQMEPLFEELNKRSAIVVMHPHRPAQLPENVFTASVIPAFEFVCDTTRAVLNIIANGVLERYPNITLIVPHNGSFLPNIYPRLILLMDLLKERELMEPLDMKKNFARLYFDTSGNTNPNTEFLLTCADPTHIMYGSDYPFTPGPRCIKMLEATKEYFAKNDRISPYQNEIFTQNCKQLFKLK